LIVGLVRSLPQTMGADRIGPLRRRGVLELGEDGRLHFYGAAARLYQWLQDELKELVLAAGAAPFEGVDTIDRATLDTAGYFESFVDGAIETPADRTRYFAPAACYQVYAAMRGERLDTGRLLSVAACCGRREARATDEVQVGRLQRFCMREAVLVGPAAWAAAEREFWMERVSAVAASLGLAGTLEPATDTFFGGTGRGRQLVQQLKNLKYELRVDAGSAGRLAIASFNLHESFFTSRFDIGPMSDGSPAVSGCVAFGLERWTLACLAQHDERAVDALVKERRAKDERGATRSTTNT
jgi:seryl-tRNA synthetase